MSRPDGSWHSYFWPGTTVLRNKFDITDPALLSELEYRIVEVRAREIMTPGPAISPSFDASHLKSIHAHLFGELYDWAGGYRTVNISKSASGGRTNHFGDHASMDMYLRQVRVSIAAVDWTDLPDSQLAHRLADVHTRLNFAHPFREGNGRATRIFMRHLAARAGRTVAFAQLSADTWNSASAATFAHPHGLRLDSQPLEELYRQIIGRG